jgi:thiol-disulfide isomerase/thioredoxin
MKGKYVYIDVWATWCGPCRAEIPYLKKAEEKYHGKNIEFVSISVDTDKDHDKWKNFVTEKALGGIQLFADKNWNSDFIKAFGINSIPRFILIDPNGVVVDADAKRPSNPKLIEQLDGLLK